MQINILHNYSKHSIINTHPHYLIDQDNLIYHYIQVQVQTMGHTNKHQHVCGQRSNCWHIRLMKKTNKHVALG